MILNVSSEASSDSNYSRHLSWVVSSYDFSSIYFPILYFAYSSTYDKSYTRVAAKTYEKLGSLIFNTKGFQMNRI